MCDSKAFEHTVTGNPAVDFIYQFKTFDIKCNDIINLIRMFLDAFLDPAVKSRRAVKCSQIILFQNRDGITRLPDLCQEALKLLVALHQGTLRIDELIVHLLDLEIFICIHWMESLLRPRERICVSLCKVDKILLILDQSQKDQIIFRECTDDDRDFLPDIREICSYDVGLLRIGKPRFIQTAGIADKIFQTGTRLNWNLRRTVEDLISVFTF